MDPQQDVAALRYHGGNIDAARRLFPDAPQPWIDLSTGINPLPYPVGTLQADVWTRLPDASALTRLESTARAAYRTSPNAGLVAAPGTQALIQWLPRIFPARRVGVLGPTYQEHAAAWQAAGADATTVPTLADLTEFETGIIVNPNNPDGRTLSPESLADAAHRFARHGGRLIVDEAFIDLESVQHSVLPHLPLASALVLRSFGKTYGLAGLRLGFAAGTAPDCDQIRSALGPWPVAGPAIAIAQRAFADTAWLDRTAERLRHGANRLDRLLQSAGFDIIGGTSLFRLARHDAAASWFTQLCRNGILTRPFHAQPDWLRLGLPGTQEDWTRLEAAVRP